MGNIVDISEVLLELGLSASVTDEDRAIVQSAINKAEGAIKRHLKYDPVQAVRTEYYPQIDLQSDVRQVVWETDGSQAFLREFQGSASNELQVQHIPIRKTDSDGSNAIDLRIDFDGRADARSGSFGSDKLKVEGTDFWPRYDMLDSSSIQVSRDGILKHIGSWPTSSGSVKIVYTAGYTGAELHGQDARLDASPIVDAVIGESVKRVLKSYSVRKGKLGFIGALKSERAGDYSYSRDTGSLTLMVGGSVSLLPETIDGLTDFVNYGWAMAS